MSRIRVKNFGPVLEGYLENDGWMDLKKVTVFIGNQGSGKSTVAKLYSTLTWIEKSMVRGQIQPDGLRSNNRFLKHLKYQKIDNYVNKDTEFEYIGKSFHFRFHAGLFYVDKVSENGYVLPKIMYVPAERNFLSVVDHPEKIKNLPSTMFTFLDEYDKARKNFAKGVELPFNNVKFEFDSQNKLAHISGNGYKLRLSESSSGFQSTVPLFLVTKYLTETLKAEEDPSVRNQSIEDQRRLAKEIERIINDPAISDEVRQESLRQLSSRYKPSCFINIVEEPEQNLFPGSQQKLLYTLLKFNNQYQDNKLLFTTHSPYLINYLSIAIQGGYLLDQIQQSDKVISLTERLEKVVPVESVIHADEVIVYQMDETTGTIHRLPDSEGILSDSNYLNQSIRLGNIQFDQLLEIEEEL